MYAKSITNKRMAMRWGFHRDRLFIEMAAPTMGWVAVGFNMRRQLSGSLLIMGAVLSTGIVHVEDHAILRVGEHQSRSALGEASLLANVSGSQARRGRAHTQIQFSLPTSSNDNYMLLLTRGMDYHLIMAYSVETDFQHHSRVRIWEKVTL